MCKFQRFPGRIPRTPLARPNLGTSIAFIKCHTLSQVMFYKADFCGKLRKIAVKNSTTSSLINRQAFCGFWSSLCFKPVLAQSARCKMFVTKVRQLSLGLPQNEPCSICYRLWKSEFFYLFAWGIANFLRLEVGVLKIFLIKNNFT